MAAVPSDNVTKRARIVLVRHGETEWSRALKHTGRTDVPLTEDGEREARLVGKALAGFRFGRVLSSPLQRALGTARLALPEVDPEIRPELAEFDYGDYEGITTAEIRESVPDWTVWRYGAAGGETVEDVGGRVDRIVAELREEREDVAVFAHGHVLRVLTARWLELEPVEGRRFVLDTGTISILGYERETTAILRWNEPLEAVAIT
jgi:broad specificity phosphatase PhoE